MITDDMLIHYCMANREHETCRGMFDMLHTYFTEKLSQDEQFQMVTDHKVCVLIDDKHGRLTKKMMYYRHP